VQLETKSTAHIELNSEKLVFRKNITGVFLRGQRIRIKATRTVGGQLLPALLAANISTALTCSTGT
jgi:hypothetical protein